MLKHSKFLFILSFLVSTLILSACSHPKTPLEKMYFILEHVVSAEKGFEDQQESLVSLEKQENGFYNQIIGLSMKQYDQIVKLSTEAIQSADNREIKMNNETESIKESKTIFNQFISVKGQIDDPVLKKMANQLYVIMENRYDAHDLLYKEYIKGIKEDKKLYEMFEDKNLSIEELEGQIDKTNKVYQEIYDANTKFNQLTSDYNKVKLTFYQKSGFKINEKSKKN